MGHSLIFLLQGRKVARSQVGNCVQNVSCDSVTLRPCYFATLLPVIFFNFNNDFVVTGSSIIYLAPTELIEPDQTGQDRAE